MKNFSNARRQFLKTSAAAGAMAAAGLCAPAAL
ncbi:MAG: twin-arginine translocation signal domain-containing protein, partial [Boseongicola sp. SB0664_bin_43]|nr:twin-arginine translocation signal domain-containing protein [Boseongicola sp. SB0664_bin_43]